MTSDPALTPGAAALWSRVRARTGVRVKQTDLLADLLTDRPDLATDATRWTVLARLLEELVSAGLVEAAKGSHRRERLPPSVKIVGRVSASGRPNPAGDHPWAASMQWAGSARLTSGQLKLMEQLNRWVARVGDPPVVPVRERSLEVFGDDKVLGVLLNGLLRPEGRCPEILRVEPAHAPMAVERVHPQAGPDLLVVENGTTFRSALRALRDHHQVADVVIGWVGYGAGYQLSTVIESARDLRPLPAHIWYFGDLDPHGLAIAARGAKACEMLDLPPLRPHIELYRTLMTMGRPQPRKADAEPGWPMPGTQWLGAELAAERDRSLGADRWLAQEWVGYQALIADRTWTTPGR